MGIIERFVIIIFFPFHSTNGKREIKEIFVSDLFLPILKPNLNKNETIFRL
jgi:hypothetical protein